MGGDVAFLLVGGRGGDFSFGRGKDGRRMLSRGWAGLIV